MNKNLENLEYIFEKLIETSQNLERSHMLLKDKISFLEIKLENNRKYLENILNSITNGVCTIDTSMNVNLLNPAAKKILSIEDYKDKNLKDLFGIEITDIMEVLNYCESNEVHIISKKGQQLKLKINASAIYDNEKIIGAALIFEDITKIEALKQENQQKEKLATLGQMAASVAHDIRNPLASINLFISLLEDEVQNKQEIIKNINTNIQRIDEIITNTLLIAKKIVIKTEQIKIIEMIEQIEKEIANKLLSFNINLHKKVSSIVIFSDVNLLKSIITNLLTNAIEAAQSQVDFQIYLLKRTLTIIVKDDGCNIRDINVIFEPFFSEKEGGTGLGLFIVKKAVESLNGTIKVIVGAKTIFIVKFDV